MVELSDLLREHTFGRRMNVREDKHVVATAIDTYLGSYPAVTSLEVQQALIPFVPDRYDRSALSTPNGNRSIAGAVSFHFMSLAEAAKRFLNRRQAGNDVVVHYGEGRGRIIVYYQDEAHLLDYLQERLRQRQEIHYDFIADHKHRET